MTKQQKFSLLAEEVNKCHICENMKTIPYFEDSECLTNAVHGLDTDTPFVNLWNLWQGNLDSEIMVIGQDFGQIEDIDILKDKWNNGTYQNYTDKNLRELFEYAFKINIDSKNTPLFFTNMANCYRKKSTTGEMHSGWLPICANKFMFRLIDIIQPKIIIVLGRNTFEALFCLDGAKLICIDDKNKIEKENFATVIKHNYKLKSLQWEIPVFPVYHPGANSQINRSFEEQKNDWKRIYEIYSNIK